LYDSTPFLTIAWPILAVAGRGAGPGVKTKPSNRSMGTGWHSRR
jgi:hypothetical protein